MISYQDAAAFAAALTINLTVMGLPVAIGVAAAFRLARTASPRVRYVIAVAAFCSVSLLPVILTLNAATKKVSAQTPPAAVANALRNITGGILDEKIEPVQFPRASVKSKIEPSAPVSPVDNFLSLMANSSAADILLACWILVFLILLVREAVGHAHLMLARRRWQEADEALRGELAWPGGIPLYLSEHEGPCAVGLFRSAVIIPARSVTELKTDELRLITRHELAHVKWRDPLFNGLMRILRAALWPSLSLWYLERVARSEREAAADRAAISPTRHSPGACATDYASLLLSVAKWSGRVSLNGRRTLIATEVGDNSGLEIRVRRLLPPYKRPSAARLSLAGLILCAGVSGPAVLPVASRTAAGAFGPTTPVNRKGGAQEVKAEQAGLSSPSGPDVWLIVK
ncbi:MAG: hypothetical protein M3362_15635, partial [Acidobacteriota bacterium]|nr:hypothetical protein [Acidobacteriota bacterium]